MRRPVECGFPFIAAIAPPLRFSLLRPCRHWVTYRSVDPQSAGPGVTRSMLCPWTLGNRLSPMPPVVVTRIAIPCVGAAIVTAGGGPVQRIIRRLIAALRLRLGACEGKKRDCEHRDPQKFPHRWSPFLSPIFRCDAGTAVPGKVMTARPLAAE